MAIDGRKKRWYGKGPLKVRKREVQPLFKQAERKKERKDYKEKGKANKNKQKIKVEKEKITM